MISMPKMLCVSIETPWRADTLQHKLRNYSYAMSCVADSLERGEAPYASHLFYTQFLDDSVPRERQQGLDLSHEWRKVCDKIVVYTDLGISHGMQEAIDLATASGIPVEHRTLPGWPFHAPG